MAWQRSWGDETYSAEEWRDYKHNQQQKERRRWRGRWGSEWQSGGLSKGDLNRLAEAVVKTVAGHSESAEGEGYQAVGYKKGEWDCQVCPTKRNYKNKLECRGCGALKPTDGPKTPVKMEETQKASQCTASAAAVPSTGGETAAKKEEASASDDKTLPTRIQELEKVLKSMEDLADGEELRKPVEQKLEELKELHKKDAEAVKEARPALARLHAAQARVDRVTKSASEQDARIAQLKEQLGEAEAAKTRLASDLEEAQADVARVAQEMSKACQSEKKDEAPQPMDTGGMLEEAMQQVQKLQRQAQLKAVATARWVLHAGLQEDCEQAILTEVLEDFPDTVPDMEEEIQKRLQQEASEEEKQAREEAKAESLTAGRGRSRSPAREKLLKQLIVEEHSQIKKQLAVLRSVKI